MRVDKFLWTIRVFKTRNQASEACKKGQVKIGDNKLKSSKEVYAGEIIKVRKNQINHIYEILNIPDSRVGGKLVSFYIKDLTPKEEFERTELMKFSKDYYRKKGSGRPTKKDRRDIENYNNDIE